MRPYIKIDLFTYKNIQNDSNLAPILFVYLQTNVDQFWDSSFHIVTEWGLCSH